MNLRIESNVLDAEQTMTFLSKKTEKVINDSIMQYVVFGCKYRVAPVKDRACTEYRLNPALRNLILNLLQHKHDLQRDVILSCLDNLDRTEVVARDTNDALEAMRVQAMINGITSSIETVWEQRNDFGWIKFIVLPDCMYYD